MPDMPPDEWVASLEQRLTARLSDIETWNAYYEGEHRLQFASEKFRKAFGGLFDEFADNWCAPVVNAADERLAVVGFRFGDDSSADADAWRLWQANHLDAEHKLAIKAALIDSRSALLVWPDPDDETVPEITVEAADQVEVAYAPGSRYRRVAALKRFTDEWTGDTFATLYLPDGVYKFRWDTTKSATVAEATRVMRPGQWVPREVSGEQWPLPNPLGVVPIVEIRNDPRLRYPPRSELRSVIPLQDAINKLVADMMVASEFGAFRQKWATGVEIPVDPDTNQPIEAWRVAVERFITAPPGEIGDEPARFGDFSETQLANFREGIDMLVMHVASHTRTPPHYLNASADRLSGESIKAAETGLVSKVRDKQLHMGEAFEEAMRLAFRVLDDPRSDFVAAETIWADPESRTEAEHIDAVGKKRQMLDIPLEQTWEDAGYSPTQIARFKADLAAGALLGGEDGTTAREVAELLSKVTSAVMAGVLSADEARALANRAGAGFTDTAPERPAPPGMGALTGGEA